MEHRGGRPLRDEDLPYLCLRSLLAWVSVAALAAQWFVVGSLAVVAQLAHRRYSWEDAVLDPPLPEALEGRRG